MKRKEASLPYSFAQVLGLSTKLYKAGKQNGCTKETLLNEILLPFVVHKCAQCKQAMLHQISACSKFLVKSPWIAPAAWIYISICICKYIYIYLCIIMYVYIYILYIIIIPHFDGIYGLCFGFSSYKTCFWGGGPLQK